MPEYKLYHTNKDSVDIGNIRERFENQPHPGETRKGEGTVDKSSFRSSKHGASIAYGREIETKINSWSGDEIVEQSSPRVTSKRIMLLANGNIALQVAKKEVQEDMQRLAIDLLDLQTRPKHIDFSKQTITDICERADYIKTATWEPGDREEAEEITAEDESVEDTASWEKRGDDELIGGTIQDGKQTIRFKPGRVTLYATTDIKTRIRKLRNLSSDITVDAGGDYQSVIR